jgi:hypothetical protein
MKNLITPITEMFKRPPPEVTIMDELTEARHELLKAQSGLEYAKAMVEYHSARIRRLTSSLQTSESKN